MQYSGGYKYPSGTICVIFTFVVIFVSVGLIVSKALPLHRIGSVIFSLEGTVLLASAFTPKGLVPPQGNLRNRIKWFFKQPHGVPVEFSQPLYYGGILFLIVGILLSAVGS